MIVVNREIKRKTDDGVLKPGITFIFIKTLANTQRERENENGRERKREIKCDINLRTF